METKHSDLYERRKQLIAEAQGIIDQAKSGGRNLTRTENSNLENLKEQVQDVQEQITRHEKSTAVMDEFTKAYQANGGKIGTPEPFDAKTHRDNLAKAARAKQGYAFEVDQRHLKSLSTAQTQPLATYASDGNLVSTVPGTAAASLRELFAQEQAASGSVRYYRLGYKGAAIVEEGDLKPDAEVNAEPVDATLKKVATTFKVSDELTEDSPKLFEAVTSEAAREILRRENQLIVDTLKNTSGINEAETDADNFIDAVADAIAEISADTGAIPGALVLSPKDFATIRKAKVSNGNRLTDPFDASPATLWDMQLFPSNALTAGEAYTLTPGAGVFYSRGPLRIETGFAGDDFVRNMLTTRVEERVLPAIIRPEYITRINVGE